MDFVRQADYERSDQWPGVGTVTNEAIPLLHAIYEYRTLLMQAYFYGDALDVKRRVKLSGLDRSLSLMTNPTSPHEREFKRVTCRMSAGLFDGGGWIRGRAVNLSAGGVCLRNAAALPSHPIVTLRVDGPCDYRFPARMVWFARDNEDDWRIGLVFVGAPVELRRRQSYDQ